MKKKILHQAFEELSDAIAYYEEQQAGLGLRLKESINMSIGFYTIPLFHKFVEAVTVVLISKYLHTILPTLFVKIHYGFLQLHIVIVSLNTGLKERAKSASKSKNHLIFM